MHKTSQGERLRVWRMKRKLTQEALADLLGVGQGSLSAYETDARVPRLDVAARIERATEGAITMRGWAA